MKSIAAGQLNTKPREERPVSLAEFRSQYVERVVALLGRDIRKAASALGVQRPELETLVSCSSK